MNQALYYLKRRDYLGKTKQGVYGYRPAYGKWQVHSQYLTEWEARAAKHPAGLYDWGIFHQGKRLAA